MQYIDLFAGAGGLSEGFTRAGATPIAHVEMNKDACDTLRTRATYHYLKSINRLDIYENYLLDVNRKKEDLWNHVPLKVTNSVLNKEISDQSVDEIFTHIDNTLRDHFERPEVDLIIGGPPCQAYSVAGRARDPQGMRNDPRNLLYLQYVKFLVKYKPKMFVFENVPGILSANNGVFLNQIFEAVREAGYNLDIPRNKHLNAKDFGVLQDRKRVIIIGWRNDLNMEYPDFEQINNTLQVERDLFFDLPKLKNGEGSLNVCNYIHDTNSYLRNSGIRGTFNFTTQHICRPNNENDLEIYSIAVDEWNKGKRLNYSTLPSRLIRHKNVKSFTNRFQVVNGKGVSHTVVAHIAMDGHYYIHPDKNQNRSISLREAARIQSFPDDFFFEGSRTAAFKQIGNAVPPLMGYGIALKLKEILE